jgi:hypothetical protein
MPASYKIDKERKLVLSTAFDIVIREDILGHQERLSKDPDFDPHFSQLIDFSDTTQIDITPEDVRLFARRNIFSPDSRRAIVVKDDFQFGLARMFGIHRELAGETGIRVFRNMDDAMQWIFPKEAAS